MGQTGKAGTSTFDVLFSHGFRPFFLGAALHAVLAMALWLAWIGFHAAGVALTFVPFSPPPHQWHAHEMIYGYAAAIVAGFLLTAVPNWTGVAPARGAYVAAIATLWLLGRLAMLFSGALPAMLVMAIDVLFIPVLAVKILTLLLGRSKLQNMLFPALLVVLTIGNLLTHLDWVGVWNGAAFSGNRLGLLTLAALIAILGGRVTPAFTRNALVQSGDAARLPLSRPWLDRIGIAGAIALAPLAAWSPDERLVGAVALLAGLSNAARLMGWRGLAVRDRPIVWSLHLGFLFLALGYLALAAHWLGAPIGEASALHVIAIGAVGVMTVAIMSRAALGHTGRALIVARPIAAAYAVLAVAAVVRAAGPAIVPDHYDAVILGSGALWIAAFTIFAFVYAPILVGERVDMKP